MPRPASTIQQAVQFHRSGQLKKAERAYRDLLRRNPGDAALLQLLALLMRERGEPGKAIELLRRALKSNPKKVELHADLGLAFGAAGRVEEAAAALTEAVALAPDRADIHYHLGQTLLAARRARDAVVTLVRCVELDADNLDYREALTKAHLSLGRLPVDTTHAQALVDADPRSAAYRTHLATALRLNNELEAAEAEYREAMSLDPDHAPAIAGLAQVLESRGRTEEAYELIRDRARASTSFLLADAYTRVCRRRNAPAEALDVLQKLVDQGGLTPYHDSIVQAHLGKALEATGRYDEAFEHYRRSNRPNAGQWDQRKHEAWVAAIMDQFSREKLTTLPHAEPRGRRPIFIVGMFRSGTTLTESILASHPKVYGAGELEVLLRLATELPSRLGVDLPYPACMPHLSAEAIEGVAAEYQQAVDDLAPDAERVSDKMPLNYLNLGLISLAFPDASIVHCLRDPLDTCFSCYATGFAQAHAYTADLGDLAAAYRSYQEVMQHWNRTLDVPIFEMQYETLVRDQEPVTRALLEFCGLEWDDSCLRFHESGRVAQTPSVDQVRTNLYETSIGRGQRFERHLKRLIKGLS